MLSVGYGRGRRKSMLSRPLLRRGMGGYPAAPGSGSNSGHGSKSDIGGDRNPAAPLPGSKRIL